MPPTDPMKALRGAASIGAGPLDSSKLGPVTQSVVPMLPGSILSGLKGILGMGAEAPASPALSSLTSYKGAPVAEMLGETHPEFTPVGGEDLYNMAKQGLHYVPKAESLVRYLGGFKP